MDTSVRDLLSDRQRQAGRRRPGSVLASLLIHGGIAAAFLLTPALAARDEAPIRATRVQIVPLKALGVPDPRPARRPEPEPPPKPEPEPEPERPAPRPADEEERRRVPSPDAPRRTEPTPAPAGPPAEPGVADQGPGQRRGAPDGSPLGLAPFGSNESGFDDPDFQYGYYSDMIVAIIGSNYRRPSIATEAELIVHFRIARDGTIYEVEITQPSGYVSLDQAGLSAVRGSTLPNLPVSYSHDSLGVSLIIR